MRNECIVKNLANIITAFRILCSVLMLVFPVFSVAFYVVYILAGISDMIDGTIARKTNSISEFGSKFDTIADFVFILFSFVKIAPMIHIPCMLWIWISVIACIKIANVVLGFVFARKLIFLHTTMNKILGLMLFIFPLTFSFVCLNYTVVLLSCVATFSAIQEGYYIVIIQTKQ